MLTQEDLQAIKGLFDKRFDDIDQRFDGIDKKFDTIDKKFDGIDKKFDAIDKKFDTIDKKFDSIDKKFDGINTRLEHLETTTSLMKGDINALKDGQRNICRRLDAISEKVDYTYHLAIDNWGNLVESKKRLDILEG